jgi:archaellum component FlaF (FlaF/FlaG flagellin family)
MKRQLAKLVILGLVALGTGTAKADLLFNGSLDSTNVSSQTLATPLGWVAAANKAVSGPFSDGLSSETFANVFAPGGFGVFFKPFQGITTDKITASLYQDNPATPGQTYTLTGWAGAGANYIGLTDPTVGSEFHLQFLDSTSTVIGDAKLNLMVNGQHVLGTPNGGNAFGYFNYTLSATAPAGTVSVRALAEMINAYNNPLGGDQAFVVDAFTLVPEPSVISFGILGLAGLLGFRSRK